ncbi:hypothetical protein CBS76997_3486 [Aspergillus niger]|nr:hypothetical protein CBS13152_3145 [Aspergillus niger]KAI3033346.1 hypothetical protein CBS147345_910 [Aspergillus niger]KAI3047383.1 hypothetical protein CBS76997_3486 [Aspergillus niger]
MHGSVTNVIARPGSPPPPCADLPLRSSALACRAAAGEGHHPQVLLCPPLLLLPPSSSFPNFLISLLSVHLSLPPHVHPPLEVLPLLLILLFPSAPAPSLSLL